MSENLSKINILTATQYASATKNEDELYLVVNDDTASASSSETFGTVTASSNVYTLDLSTASNFAISASDTVAKTIAFANVPATTGTRLTVQLYLDFIGQQPITFPSSIWWNDYSAPTFNVGDKYIITLTSYDNGTKWFSTNIQQFTGTVVSDTFARTDSTTALGTSDTGHAWTALSGTWGISSGKAYLPDTTSATKIAVVDSGKSDAIIISADVYYDATSDAGLAFRVGDTSNYLCVTLAGNVTSYYLKKVVSGVATNIATATLPTYGITVGNTVNVKVKLTGTRIDIYLNNVWITNVTVTEFTTNTKHGIKFYAGANDRFDNFIVKKV